MMKILPIDILIILLYNFLIMKITKLELYIIDCNENDYPLKDVEVEVERALEDYGTVTFGEAIEKELVGIDSDTFDDSKWNKIDTPIEEYRKLFEK